MRLRPIPILVLFPFALASIRLAGAPAPQIHPPRAGTTELSDAAAAAAGLDRFDRRFVEQTVAGAQTAAALCRLADDRALDPRIRDFALPLGREWSDWVVEMSSVAHDRNVPVENDLRGDRLFRDLSGTNAARFDNRFLDAVIGELRRDVARFTTATETARDDVVRRFAGLHLDALRRALTRAEQLRNELRN